MPQSDANASPVDADRLQRFMFEELDIRGALARLDEAWASVRGAQRYPEPVERLLGELLTATALLASIVKVSGTLTVQATGDGPLAALMAECRDRSNLRGIARIRDAKALRMEARDDAAGTGILGKGLVTITIRPDIGDRVGEAYQGIVPLDGSSIAEALEGYFAQSEQIPTRIWLSTKGERSAGMLIQALPPEMAHHDHGERRREEDFGRITLLADTVSGSELRELPGERLLTRLFFEETVALQRPEGLAFACSCSRERTRDALRAIAEQELEEIIAEEGDIRMECQFCHAEYRFDRVDVAAVHASAAPDDGQVH
ncbi:MAG: Hsp33 family molecular chaperone HslO [Gammaproteobacteria bacterium]|nr:MAG: Hsp33 family molecular chaperone HslO [Gammaproteobacteria bacterium]